MKDERWKMKDERWKMKDERWKITKGIFVASITKRQCSMNEWMKGKDEWKRWMNKK